VTPRIPKRWATEVACLYTAVALDLTGFARKLVQGDVVRADDLVQDVFHEAALGWHRIRRLDIGEQRAWLFSVARKKAISRWRASSLLDVWADTETCTFGTDDTHDKALNSIALARCWEVVKAMPPVRYRVAYLRWHEDWSPAEIGRLLNIAQSTVRVHLKNARDELQRAVGADVTFLADSDPFGDQGEEVTS